MPGIREACSMTILWERAPRNVVWGLPHPSASSQELTPLLSCRDGAPYCEKDYQGLFGVRCEACHQFITGKVLEVSDRRAPLKASHFLKGPHKHTASSSIFFLTERKESRCR